MKSEIFIKKVDPIQQQDIEEARTCFISYFSDLYIGLSPESLGIPESKAAYLAGIFNRTEQALIEKKLHLIFAYIKNHIVGFATYEFLSEEKFVLIRTLPVNLLYKHKELEIRNCLIRHISKQFTDANTIVIMVRKTNSAHQDLCLKAGFKQSNNIFDDSLYIKNAYDSKWYYGYSY
jgi:hypothetical protein